MAMRRTHDAVYVEKYTDRNGEEKKRYTNIGSLLTRDDGSMAIKLETIPVGFSGWISLYVPKPRESADKPAAQSAQRDSGGSLDPADDIPF